MAKKYFSGVASPRPAGLPHLRAWRRYRSLTAAELHRRGGPTGSFISQLEKGRSHYKQQTLEALADALDITPGALLDIDPENPRQNKELRFPPGFWDRVPDHRRKEVDMIVNVAREAIVLFVVRYVDTLTMLGNGPSKLDF